MMPSFSSWTLWTLACAVGSGSPTVLDIGSIRACPPVSFSSAPGASSLLTFSGSGGWSVSTCSWVIMLITLWRFSVRFILSKPGTWS
jgi:hypothetical protein